MLAVLALDWLPRMNEYVLSVAAASFLYVAMADLIPDLHRGRIDATTLRQLALALAGIGTVVGTQHIRRRTLMYALAIIRYRKPLEEVLVHQDAHRAYLRD